MRWGSARWPRLYYNSKNYGDIYELQRGREISHLIFVEYRFLVLGVIADLDTVTGVRGVSGAGPPSPEASGAAVVAAIAAAAAAAAAAAILSARWRSSGKSPTIGRRSTTAMVAAHSSSLLIVFGV